MDCSDGQAVAQVLDSDDRRLATVGTGFTPEEQLKVLRVAHHGVVSAWRERERQLRLRGVDVRMLSAKRWNEGGRAVDLEPYDDDFVIPTGTMGTHPAGFLYDPRPIMKLLRARPDILDLHEEPFALATAEILALRALSRSRVPYVLYSAQNLEKRYPIPFRWLERWALRGAAGAYVCNREAGEILRRKGLRADARLIPLGVDTAVFAPATRTAPSKQPIIGYLGRLEPYKGVDTLLRAAAGRPGWRVEITGEGPQRPALEALARELGIADRVSFLGFAEGELLADRYRRLDIVVVPSIPWPGWREQFCRVAVEAMASGVPVVASRSGAIPDVVADAGILVEPGDPVALAAGVDEALEPRRWSQLRKAGVARSAEFTWERVAEQHAALYASVLGARSSGEGRVPHVVAIAYGDPDMLAGAFAALGEEVQATIVDNSSSELTRALAESLGATYIDPGRNLGFGAGVNVALASLSKRGRGEDDVLLLNPDARIDMDDVRRMHRTLHGRRDIAAVGASQTEPDSGDDVRVWWPFPGPGRAWLEAAGLGRLNRAQGFAIGSVLLLRAEAIAEVGAFDERYFLYAEEVDWQKRATDAGWRIAVAETAATHIGGATSGDGMLREALFFASNEIYQRKHFGVLGWQAFRAAMIIGATARGILLRNESGERARRRRRIFVRGPVRHAADLQSGDPASARRPG